MHRDSNKVKKINKLNKKNKIRNSLFFVFILTISVAVNLHQAYAQDYYVSAGAGNSIQQALDKAKPGDVIHLKSGVYYQDFDTKRAGTASAPITITGPADAVIKGAGRTRIAQIFHDYYHLNGFTFDGLAGDPNNKGSYRDKLLYVQGTGIKEGVNGLKITNMNFRNSGGEALRIRYFAHDNEVAYSKFENIGRYDFKFGDGGKNGEAIYLGTSSNQWADGKNPTADPDGSTRNRIHHNTFNTQGNEAVDIKEGAFNNIVENNVVTGQKDPESGCLDSRGDKNIFRYNDVYGCAGAGIRLGGHNINGHQYGVDNEVYGNKIHDNLKGGIKFEVSPQKNICGNEMSGNQGGNAVGTYKSSFDPVSTCSFTLSDLPGDDPGNTTPVLNLTNVTNTTPPTLAGDGEITVSASGHDGNVPENTLDKNLSTRWSAQGDGAWISYGLGTLKKVDSLKIAFHKGNSRVQYFEIQLSEDQASWKKVFSGKSNGESNNLQNFEVPDQQARYVKIIGHGNSENAWNSITEVEMITLS